MRAKIILRVVAIVTVLVIALLLLSGWLLGPKLKSISSQPRYAQMLSKHYRLRVDCYIVKDLTDSQGRVLLIWPGRKRAGLPVPVSEEHVGHKTGEDEILGTALKGTTFIVKDVVERKTAENTFHIFLVVLDSDRSANPRVLDAIWLTTLETPAKFDKDLVEELSEEKKLPNATRK
jgi:hypothetical protein